MSNTSRLSPDERKGQILLHAVALSQEVGYRNIGIVDVAKRAGLQSHSLINHYFGSIEKLKNAVLNHAIETENLEIVLQAVVIKDNSVKISKDLKYQALLKLSCE